MTSNKPIDLAQLVEDITKIVLKSSFIIKEISQNFTQVFYKDELLDPVTQADYLVQHTIVRFISQKYPGLRIVGEENLEADDEIYKKIAQKGETMEFNKINPNALISSYPFKKKQVFVEIQKLCLWIDPLDCTRGFVSNKKEEVTILCGITENCRPVAGVICQPFKLKSKKICEFNPRVYVGSEYFTNEVEKKFCYEYSHKKNSWKKHEEFDSAQHSKTERKVAISSRRIPPKQHYLMNNVSMERAEMGGAGNKFVALIKKEVGTLMFINARTSKWDSCAGQAIIKAMGGFAIKPNMETIIYDPDSEYFNEEGFIISLSHNVFRQIRKCIESEDFQNMQSNDMSQFQLLAH